jgi:hypothetical protein
MATASAALPGAAIPDDQFVEVHPQHAGQPRLRRRGALAYLAAYDTGRTRVFGHCAASTGIEPFMALVEQVMTREPYASATRVFWIVDNGSSHCGQAAIDRLAKRFPNAVMVHTPRHASWLNQIEIYFPVVQRKAVAPNDFTHLDQLRQRLADFQQRYNATARPLGWKVTSAPQLTSTTCSTGSTSTSNRPPHRPPRRPHDQTPDELTGQTTKRGQRMGSWSWSHPGLPTPPRTAHHRAKEAA